MVNLKVDRVPEGDEVVISGISGRFPSARNVDEFRDKLFSKDNLVGLREETFWNDEKLDVPRKVGTLGERDKFDSAFYGLHASLVTSSDPLILFILEKAYEAIVDAGINPSSLKGTNTAVFTGSMLGESENFAYGDISYNYSMLGHNRGMLSNRISYWLDINGSSVSFVSMETCGFEVLTAAYNEIKNGRCDTALVGAAHLVFTPEMCFHFKQLGFLSKNGKCKPFDAEADGYLQSEGIVMLVLQRARDAKRIYATVVNSEISFNGERNNSFVIPHEKPFTDLLERFYSTCGVDPSEIAYLEADGSGVKRSDEEEMKAIDKVLLKNRKTPLLIGSVKSNMGHSLGCANLCGLIKVLLAFQEGFIPPNLYFDKPSQTIPALVENRAKVVTELTPLIGEFVALNGISMCGSYAHVLLKSYDKKKLNNFYDSELPYLVIGSSRTKVGMQEILTKLTTMTLDVEFIALMHSIHSSNILHHTYRGFVIVPKTNVHIQKIQHYDGLSRPVWFIFSGMGSQWTTMGKELMKLPVCAAAIEKCHKVLAEKGLDLLHIITAEDEIFDNILHSFVGIAAIQIALVDMLNLLGIKPDGMLGHSVGELGCAYADGCLSLEEMILSSYYRGLASLQAKLIPGFMAAVGLGHKNILPLLPQEIDVACHNNDKNCTISGPEEVVKQFVADLQKHHIFAKAVNVANIAYHSRYIKPAAPYLLEFLQKLIQNPKKRSDLWLSTSVSEDKWDTPLAQYCSAEYLTNNLLSPVLFEETCKRIPKNAVVIEISPHGLLQSIIRQSLDVKCTSIPLTQRREGAGFTLSAVGKLYLAGLNPQIEKLYPPVKMPVSQGTQSISPLVTWEHSVDWKTSAYEFTRNRYITGEVHLEVQLNHDEYKAYKNHQVNGSILFPAFGFLKIVWKIFTNMKTVSLTQMPVVFENVCFLNQLPMTEKETKSFYVLVHRGSGHFEISCGKTLLVIGQITIPENLDDLFDEDIPCPTEGIDLTEDDIYSELELRGYEYRESFRGIKGAKTCKEGLLAKVRWENNWVPFVDSLFQLVMMKCTEPYQGLKLPASIQKIVINPSAYKDQKQEVDAVYHHALRVVSCSGMQMFNVKFGSFASIPNELCHYQLLKTMKFVPYSNLKLQSTEQFISLSLHWTIENSQNLYADVAVFHANIANTIKSILPQFPQVKLSTEMAQLRSFENLYDLVVVTEEKDLEVGVSLINTGGFLLVEIENDSWKMKSDLNVIAEQKFGNVKFTLYRKVAVHTSQIVHMNGNVSTWIQQIKRIAPFHRLYAVGKLEELGVEIVLKFMQRITTELGLEHVRYFFILDKMYPKFSLNESLFKKDLILNVFYNGEWGSISFLPFDEKHLSENSVLDVPVQFSLDKIQINFLGLNQHHMDNCANGTFRKIKHTDLGPVDFSGYLKNGSKIMGIAHLDRKTKKLTSDQYLMWEIPESWSLQQATTVPVSYAIAYYCLILKAQLKHGESVLVQAGWSNVGQAAITLALDYDCTVFTTVMSNEQKVSIQHRFPQLLDKHISSCEGTEFEHELLRATKGKGVKVILNCLSGHKLQASARCLASHGRFVQLLESDVNSHQTVGMEIFLRSTEMYGVSTRSLFSLSPEWKKIIHFSMKDMIQRGIIKPMQCTVFSKRQIGQAIIAASDLGVSKKVLLSMTENDENPSAREVLISHPQGFHLVFGSELEQCVDMAKWLAVHGVKHVAIMIRNNDVPKQLERKIKLLHSYYNIEAILVKGHIMNSKTGIVNLLQEVSSLFKGPLEGIFILPLESTDQENGLTSSFVASLDVASREINTLNYFVCLLIKNSWSVCDRRCREGFPALSVYWPQHRNRNFNLLQSLRLLDTLLTSNKKHSVIIAQFDESSSQVAAAFPLAMFFPNSLNALAAFGEELKSNVSWLVEMASLSPGYRNVKGIPPVFLIPGLQGPPSEYLKPLARKLMYPIFCARIVEPKNTLTDTAGVLVKHIKEIQSSGTFCLVGLSWGGAITLEMARLLEKEGHKTRVILIDGAPDTLQATVQQLTEDGNFNANLISSLLQVKVADEISRTADWPLLLDSVLEKLSFNMKSQVSHALTILRSCLTMLLEYNPSSDLIEGEVSLVRTTTTKDDETFGLHKLCKHSVSVQKVEENHGTILVSQETANIINDFIV